MKVKPNMTPAKSRLMVKLLRARTMDGLLTWDKGPGDGTYIVDLQEANARMVVGEFGKLEIHGCSTYGHNEWQQSIFMPNDHDGERLAKGLYRTVRRKVEKVDELFQEIMDQLNSL